MKLAYSCVVDAQPKFEWQAFLWMHSLIRNAGCAARDIKIHHTRGVTDDFLESAGKLGATLVPIRPFEGGHGYCNKIQQCFSTAFQGYDRIAFCDCDLFFLCPPRLPAGCVFAAKPVDLPNPPLDILLSVFADAGLSPPPTIPVDCALSAGEMTLLGNFNGGFFIVDPSLLGTLGGLWRKHALWLLDRVEILGAYSAHVDQVAMALSLGELGIECGLLTARSNFPAHLPPERLETLDSKCIEVLHYHSNVLPSGMIRTTGIFSIDSSVGRANESIASIIDDDFNNALFWNHRYVSFPELGSGVGSRGDVLSLKKEMLRNATTLFEDKSVIDIGCGDLEATRDLPFSKYVGWDVSGAALEVARRKRPDWRFEQGDHWKRRQEADLVICLDVLIHQKEKGEYLQLVASLSESAGERLVVSGYEREPHSRSNIIAYHEPLSVTLMRCGAFKRIWEIGMYRDVSLIIADKIPEGSAPHQNEISPEIFQAAAPLADRKDILCAVMDCSHKYLGFFTKTASRVLEYPWVVEQTRVLDPGSNVLDIGAGVSPVPIMISRHGMRVTCLDDHPIVRSPVSRAEWNEWGFLDYKQIGVEATSLHENVLEFAPPAAFDAIYSISVIEHMKRETWERTLDLAAEWLKPGGLLLLTLDLIPGTDMLWNRSEGRIVDAVDAHGELGDIVRRLSCLGFAIGERRVKRRIPASRTDVALLLARAPADPK